jgi:hypothetical protein
MEEAADGVLYLAGAMGGGCESTIVALHMCGWSYARTRPHRSKTAKASKAQGRSRRFSRCSLGGLARERVAVCVDGWLLLLRTHK